MTHAARPPICHPDQSAVVRGFRAVCPVCGSFWDLENLEAESRYTADYPAARSHFDAATGALKVATLERWLSATGLAPTHRTVCEVGFGGGHCLARLTAVAQRAFGIETIAADVDHAASLGVPREAMFLAGALPERLPAPVDLWLFQDVLEHLLDPDRFLAWLSHASAPGARVLVVAPDASSLSRRLLGRQWPHRVPDHAFHWSPDGMRALWARHGFHVERSFRPVKRVSVKMLTLHLEQTRLAPLARILGPLVPPGELWFNVGELGMVFEKELSPRADRS